MARPDLRDRIVRYRADPALSREDASARISAYVYGNILIFAAVLSLTNEDVLHGHAAVVTLGAAASTFLAHVFSEVVARNVRTDDPMTWPVVRHELRDSTPIITTATVPCLLLAAAAWQWLDPRTAVIVSDVYLFVRLALVGLLIERLRSHRASLRTLLAGLLMGGAAAAIALLKVTLGH